VDTDVTVILDVIVSILLKKGYSKYLRGMLLLVTILSKLG